MIGRIRRVWCDMWGGSGMVKVYKMIGAPHRIIVVCGEEGRVEENCLSRWIKSCSCNQTKRSITWAPYEYKFSTAAWWQQLNI